ncbi:hypothetical protein Q7P37_006409 [Cladosporium fusiforme]
MALDQQSNWDIMMADNLAKVQLEHSQGKRIDKDVDIHIPGSSRQASDDTPEKTAWTGEPIYLPDEVVLQVLEYLAAEGHNAQGSLAAVCRLSHQWYSAGVPYLYRYPDLYGNNFDMFIKSICPSINLHVRKSPLSKLVKVLDMSRLVHQGSKSVTARLLGRTKESLEVFRAPQASFAINCLPSLAKCQRLRSLDLSLVSESPALPDLFRTVSHLESLEIFRLPRSSGFGVHHNGATIVWPPNLKDIALSGGIDAHFLHGVVGFPSTLRSISIEHCPLAKGFAVSHLLRVAIKPLQNLEHVKIAHMPRLSAHAMDDILFLLPQIKKLSISVDYITPAMFDEGHFSHFQDPLISSVENAQQPSFGEPLRHDHLHTLELTNSGHPNVEDKISPIDIMIALDECTIPRLRVVRVSRSLNWHSNSTSADAEALSDALQEASKRDWENREGVFADMPKEEYEKADWAERAGVWSF